MLLPALCLFLVGSSPVEASSTDAVAIWQAVQNRDLGDRMFARMTMVITDNSGHTRSRSLVSRALKFAEGRKSVLFFESPADVRNTALLSFDYDDGNKDDDQWLYLPSLHKATRIAASDKSGAFMGSDFSYADMTKRDPKDYTVSMLKQNVLIEGEDCWLIEAKPRNERTQNETGYIKTLVWISKTKLVPLQMKAWLQKGQKLKYLKFSNIKQVGGIWSAHTLTANTVRAGSVESSTDILYNELRYNDSHVSPEDFTQRRLEQGL
jgi:outer membrane lipoprotein-sorting protein